MLHIFIYKYNAAERRGLPQKCGIGEDLPQGMLCGKRPVVIITFKGLQHNRKLQAIT